MIHNALKRHMLRKSISERIRIARRLKTFFILLSIFCFLVCYGKTGSYEFTETSMTTADYLLWAAGSLLVMVASCHMGCIFQDIEDTLTRIARAQAAAKPVITVTSNPRYCQAERHSACM